MLRESCETRFVSALGVAALILLSTSGTTQAYSEKTLYSFCSTKRCTDGSEPLGEVSMDQSGNLYGTTFHGGTNDAGVVFEYQPSTGQYTVIHNFCSLADCADGTNPRSVKLVIDTAGSLYGTTYTGGNSHGNGVVFRLAQKKSGWVETVLYEFCPHESKNCADAGAPTTGLTYAGAASGQPYDGTSPLYGTTPFGGANGQGTVYEVMRKAGTKKWSETVLYSFCSQANCADGQQPEAPPFVDAAGNIYGTTDIGGQFGPQGGTVFELSPNGGGYTESTLYSFCAQANCTDGKEPYASLVMDGSGNLLGTAGGGGSNGDGAIFELSPSGAQWQYNVLASFTGKNGLGPIGNLVLDASGNLFGATNRGGPTKKGGTVFEFNGSIQTLYGFCSVQRCPDGNQPYSGVIEDAAGNIYGTTSMGAKHNSGTLYEVSPTR